MTLSILRGAMAFTAAPAGSLIGVSQFTLQVCPSAHNRRHAATRRPPQASIEQEVSQKMKEAMKSRDTESLKALRGIRAAFLIALKEAGAGDTLPDDVALAQLRRLAKMRNESITMFRQGGRSDMADAEQKELDIIEQWLPSLADAEQTTVWVKEAIEKTGASKKGDMGKVMG